LEIEPVLPVDQGVVVESLVLSFKESGKADLSLAADCIWLVYPQARIRKAANGSEIDLTVII